MQTDNKSNTKIIDHNNFKLPFDDMILSYAKDAFVESVPSVFQNNIMVKDIEFSFDIKINSKELINRLIYEK